MGGKRRTQSQSQFINESSKAHNNKFDYSKAVYTNTKFQDYYNLSTTRWIHSARWITFKWAGCSKGHTDSFRKSTGDFITLSTQAHKNKYNYSKVEYTSCDASVIIICPIHGEFTQKAKNHYEGKECPKCTPFSRKTT